MIALAAALALASSDAATAALPSGTYRYTVYVDEKPAGTTTIGVTRDGGSVDIRESTTLSDEPMVTIRTLDPATFSTLSYAVTADSAHDRIDISGTTGTYRSGDKSTPLAQATAGPSIVFDFLTGEYVAIPAMLHATSAATFNVWCDCFAGFDVKESKVVPATAPRPAGVPATDAEAAFALDDGIATLWYDPATFVLHELDVPKASIRIVIQ